MKPRVLIGLDAILKNRQFLFLAAAAAAGFAILYTVVLPTTIIPGNDLAFQLRLLNLQGIAMVAASSIGIGLLLSMNVYIFKARRAAKLGVANMAAGTGLFGSSIVSGLFASAACPACIGLLFGFLGPSTLFVAQNSLAVSIAGLAVTWAAVFGAAWVIGRGCANCKIYK